MGKRENFTAERVANFRCPSHKQQSIYWDGKTPGLGLRVTSGGGKSYVFETRLNGKSFRHTIGDPRTWTIKDAQSEATRLKAMTDQGIDPREIAREKKAAAEEQRREVARRELAVSDAWLAYIEARKSKWGVRHLTDHLEAADRGGRPVKRGKGITKPGALAPLMTLKLSDLDGKRIKAWLTREAEARPTRTDLAYRLLRVFFNWLETEPDYRGIVPADAGESRYARDILPKRAPKVDCLERGQLKAWFHGVRAIPNDTISAYLQALLLTGARRESLAALQWEAIDFRWKAIEIRDKEASKGGADGTRMIPLTEYIERLLLDLKRRNETPPPAWRILHGKRIANDLQAWEPSPWVFATKTGATGRIQDPTLAHYRACEVAGIEGLTLHGLRRSFSTLSEWLEVPAGVVAQIQGHRPSATAEKHYKRRPVDLLRVWHQRIEDWILAEAGIEFRQEQPGLRAVK